MIRQDAGIEGHLALLSGKVQPPAFAVTCNQYSSHAAPVGGFIEPVNKLSVFDLTWRCLDSLQPSRLSFGRNVRTDRSRISASSSLRRRRKDFAGNAFT
jgi:hypothetical protein